MTYELKSFITPPCVECINPYKNKWRVRWGFTPLETEEVFYYEAELVGKPTLDRIKNFILNWYNEQTDQKILTGFIWKDYPVWLSTENQFNYKAEYDLAVQTAGATLPAKFKFGTTEAPQYHIFETVEELTDFYIKVVQYIRECLDEGYAKKDAIEWKEYEV